MASTSRENTFNRDEVLAMLDVNESDGGMSSGEESELDREGYEESSEEELVVEQEEAEADVGVEDDVDDDSDDEDADNDDDNEGGIVVLSEPGCSSVHGSGAPTARGGRARGARGRGARGRGVRGRGVRGRGVRGRGVRGRGVRGRGVRGRGAVTGAVTRVVWSTKSYNDHDVGNVIPAFQPAREPGLHLGPQVTRNCLKTAADFFNLFFTVDMINSIVSHTNSYAYIQVAAGTHTTYTKPDGSWELTTPEEIRRLIAILIYFGLVSVTNSIDKYWSTKTLYHGLWARSILSRDRYKALMALLHVVDPTTETPGNKLRKVEAFVDHFKERCKMLYQPKLNMAVDERMVKSRHRSGMRQFMKDKPTRWGIKLWVLADSSNGYTIDFDIYIGKDAGRDVSAKGLGYDVVMKLMQDYLNQGYHLYFDNWYTSFPLVKDLFALGVPSCGTVGIRRCGMPDTLKNVKTWGRKVEKGDMRWERIKPTLVLQWNDNKPVSLLTTIDIATEKLMVKRKRKIGGVWREVFVNQPKAVNNYNQYMNAVDRSDQLLTANNVRRKCYRWWKTLFFHLIDMSIVNSFILFREYRAMFPDIEDLKRPTTYTMADFREEIVRGFCGFPEYGAPPVYIPTPPPPA